MRYRAFISYKHARSSAFAERLELALKEYAKPLWQPPPTIFRDEKYLRPGPDLPKMISDLASNVSRRIVLGGVTMTRLTDDLSVARHLRLKGHRGGVGVLRFPNDRWLLSGGEDNALLIHPVSAESVLDLACLTAGRTFSDIEKTRLGDTRLADACKGLVNH